MKVYTVFNYYPGSEDDNELQGIFSTKKLMKEWVDNEYPFNPDEETSGDREANDGFPEYLYWDEVEVDAEVEVGREMAICREQEKLEEAEKERKAEMKRQNKAKREALKKQVKESLRESAKEKLSLEEQEALGL